MISYAAILTHGRNDMCKNLVDKMESDGITTFVLNHNPELGEEFSHWYPYIWLEYGYTGGDFNISKLWNTLLDYVAWYHHAKNGDQDYTVTVFNDDADPSPDFCRIMSDIMMQTGVDVVSPGFDNCVIVGPPRQIPLSHRPAGWCWTVRGLSRVRPNESMAVWYSDDDLWQQALNGNGYALTTHATCGNLDADGNFSRNVWWQEQAGRDRETFKQKWGFYSW